MHLWPPTLALPLLLFGFAAVASSPSYEGAWVQADRLARDEDPAAAILILQAAAEAYPQDYAIALRLAWLCFLSARYPEAELHYRRAAALAGSGGDAALGLGFTALARGAPTEAREHFQSVLALDPESELAKEGLAAARQAWPQYRALIAATGQSWGGHPAKQEAASITGALGFRAEMGLSISAQYRLSTLPTRSVQPIDPPVPSIVQHEAWGALGYESPSLSLLGTYGYAYPTGQPDFAAHIVALSLLLPRVAHLSVEQAVSFYPTHQVYQTGLGLVWPLGAGFSVAPRGRFQWAAGSPYGAGELALAFDDDCFGVWVTGLAGRQSQPVWLQSRVVYNVPEEVGLGVQGGLRLGPFHRVTVSASYELVRLHGEIDGSNAYTANLQVLVLALSYYQ